MSPLAIYFILQLNAIRDMGTGLLIILCLTLAAKLLIAIAVASDNGDEEAGAKIAGAWLKRHLSAIFVLILLGGFIPTSGTAAAIYIIPKFVKGDTVDTVARDAGDIYKLGVARLKALLGETEKAKPV